MAGQPAQANPQRRVLGVQAQEQRAEGVELHVGRAGKVDDARTPAAVQCSRQLSRGLLSRSGEEIFLYDNVKLVREALEGTPEARMIEFARCCFRSMSMAVAYSERLPITSIATAVVVATTSRCGWAAALSSKAVSTASVARCTSAGFADNDAAALIRRHADPAADLGERAAATDAKPAGGVNDAHLVAR